MKIDLELVTQLETLTRQGKDQKVSEIIHQLPLSRCPREFATALSEVCYRNSLYMEALRVLTPVIRPAVPISPSPQPREIIAYSSALVSLNMPREAQQLLRSIHKELHPEALLIEAFSYFNEWNYEKPIRLLQQYSGNPRVSYYRQTVGRVNLAACFVSVGHLDEAAELLDRLISEASKMNYNLLLGNCLEIYGQLEIQRGNHLKAQEFLMAAEAQFKDAHSIYAFFVKKWKGICELLKNPNFKENYEVLEILRQEAAQWRHWETSRDIDLYLGLVEKPTKKIWTHLVFGTPNRFFIKKLQRLARDTWTLPSEHIWASEGVLAEKILDFTDICNQLRRKPLQLKLFQLLFRDFYRPANLGQIFSHLYPDEYFNPDTSEHRVVELFYGLRHSLKEFGSAFDLSKDRTDFILKIRDGFGIRFQSSGHRKHKLSTMKEGIRQFKNIFSAVEFGEYFGLSRRTAQITLRQWVRDGYLIRLGAGRQTRYSIKRSLSPRGAMKATSK